MIPSKENNKWHDDFDKSPRGYSKVSDEYIRIGFLSYFPPTVGGISLLSESLCNCLEQSGIEVMKMQRGVFASRQMQGFVYKIIGRGFVQHLKILWMLFKNIRRCQSIHVVSFSYLGFLPTIMSLFFARTFRRKLVIAYHGGKGEQFLKRWSKPVVWILSKSDSLLVASDYLQDLFRSYGLTPIKIHDVYPKSKFQYKSRTEYSPKFLMTRALEPIYQHETALLAFQIIKEKYPNARLSIVGKGSLEKEIKARVLALDVKGVKFLGNIPHDRMQDVYDESDIFLNPTCPDNVSVAVLEAFACGLPVVTAKTRGIEELVKDRISGLMFSPMDFQDMASKIQELLENPNLCINLAENGRKKWESYSCESVQSIYRKIYT